MVIPDSCDALYDEVVAGESTSLVETTHVNFPSKRYPEWLSTVNTCRKCMKKVVEKVVEKRSSHGKKVKKVKKEAPRPGIEPGSST